MSGFAPIGRRFSSCSANDRIQTHGSSCPRSCHSQTIAKGEKKQEKKDSLNGQFCRSSTPQIPFHQRTTIDGIISTVNYASNMHLTHQNYPVGLQNLNQKNYETLNCLDYIAKPTEQISKKYDRYDENSESNRESRRTNYPIANFAGNGENVCIGKPKIYLKFTHDELY
mgnify:CR=1 FL=1